MFKLHCWLSIHIHVTVCIPTVTGAVAITFGPGLGPIALENVRCDGSEPNLFACPSDMSDENSSQCLQHAGAMCERRLTLICIHSCV